MDKNILGFKDICAGWMKMVVYDPINDIEREMRISYLSPFFDDLLMACKFLLSDITGIYGIDLDQEGFEARLDFYKYGDKTITLQITEDFFEDEIPYDSSTNSWQNFLNQEPIPTTLLYFGIPLDKFVSNMIYLISKNKKDYNEGFAYTPSDMLDIKLFKEVKGMYKKRFEKEVIQNAKTCNTKRFYGGRKINLD